MISCIIIDDEERACETFSKIANRYLPDKLKIVAEAYSIKEGVCAIQKFSPNLVFLDIEMPDENGFKLFDYFPKPNFDVVFLTAYQHYAIKAIKYAAYDYLLKPLSYVDLMEIVQRFEKKQEKEVDSTRVQALMTNLNVGTDINSKVALPTLTGYKMEKISHILYCEGDENYTNIFTIRGDKILVSKTLKYVEDLLPAQYFFRIHKSHLVNMNYISSYDKTDGHRVVLDNGVILEVASRRIDEFVIALTRKRSE